MDYVKIADISYDKIPDKEEDLFTVLQNILKDYQLSVK